jgi:hypothetical protein
MPNELKYMETIGSFMPQPAGMVFSAAFKIFEFANGWGRTDPVTTALAKLQKEIDGLNKAVGELRQRLNATGRRIAQIENDRHLDTLTEIARETARISFRLSQGVSDAKERALLAFDAQALADRFLNEPHIWQWTDIAVVQRFDDDGNSAGEDVTPLPPDFKAQLALPAYAYAILALVAAIDLDTGGDPAAVGMRYGDGLNRHVEACTSRPNWDELSDPPKTLAENIRTRITCFPQSQNKFAVKGECRVTIVCENVMERSRTGVGESSVWLADTGPSVLCTLNPDLGRNHEEAVEDEKGVQLLHALADLMLRVLKNGSLREPLIGQFVIAPPVPFGFLYGIGLDGSVDWYRQVPGTQPEVPTGWQTRKGVRADWGAYLKFLPAGGNRIYAVHPSGELHWWQHDGFNDGEPQWTGPKLVGVGWSGLLAIVPGGDGVLYVIQKDGVMLRFRHDGLQDGGGPETWRKVTLSGGWEQFSRLFSVNEGVLYGVRRDGKLLWWRDPGFKDGGGAMEGPREVGSGWQDLRDVFGTDNGVVYAQQTDGKLLRFVHTAWKTGGDVNHWKGPVPVAFNVGGYRQVITLMTSSTGVIH